MLKIAICDDSKEDLKMLRESVAKYCNEKRIGFSVNAFSSGEAFLKSQQSFHVLFLDIMMDRLNGIELGKKIRTADKKVKIIYVTNFPNYQTDAFSVRAFGYIVKPVREDSIYRQLDDVIEYSQQGKSPVTFTFETEKGIRTFSVSDIYYFEAWSHKTRIVLHSDAFIVSESINFLLSNFRSYGFSCPHKSYLVNLMHISKIHGYDIELTSGAVIPISQKRAVEFKREFHTFLKNNFNLLIKR